MAANAQLLTELGQALGCTANRYTSEARGVKCAAECNTQEKIDGFPARCWYTGPLGPVAAPRTKVDLDAPTRMDLEARELAQRGRADIIRFCQMRRRYGVKP